MAISIQLDLEIKGLNNVPYADMEELRVQLRRHMLSFIFARAEDAKVDRRDLSVDGDIKITEAL